MKKILLYSLLGLNVLDISAYTTARDAYSASLTGRARDGYTLAKAGLDFGVYNPTKANSADGVIVASTGEIQYCTLTNTAGANVPTSILGAIILNKPADEIMNLIKNWRDGTTETLFTFTDTAPTIDGLFIKATTKDDGGTRKIFSFDAVYQKNGSKEYRFTPSNTFMLPSNMIKTDMLDQARTYFTHNNYAEEVFSSAKLRPISDQQNLYNSAGFIMLDPAASSFATSSTEYKIIENMPVALYNGATKQSKYKYPPMWLANKAAYVSGRGLLADVFWMNDGNGEVASSKPYYTVRINRNIGSLNEQVPIGSTGNLWSNTHPLGTYSIDLRTFESDSEASSDVALDPSYVLQGQFSDKYNPILDKVTGKVLNFGEVELSETDLDSGQFYTTDLGLNALVDRTSGDKFVFAPANYAGLSFLQKGKNATSKDLVVNSITDTSWKATDFVSSGSEFKISSSEKAVLPLEILSAIIAKQPQRRIDDLMNTWVNSLSIKNFIPYNDYVSYSGNVSSASLYDVKNNRVINTNGSATNNVQVLWDGQVEDRVYADKKDWYFKPGSSPLNVADAGGVTSVTFNTNTHFVLREGDYVEENEIILGSELSSDVNTTLPQGARIAMPTSEIYLYEYIFGSETASGIRTSIEVPHSKVGLIIRDGLGLGAQELTPESNLKNSTKPYFSIVMNGNKFDHVKFSGNRSRWIGGDPRVKLNPANTFLLRNYMDAENNTSDYDLPKTLMNIDDITVEKNLNNHPNWSILSNYGGLHVDIGRYDVVTYPGYGYKATQYWNWGTQNINSNPSVDYYDRVTKAMGSVPKLSSKLSLANDEVWKYFSFTIKNGATDLRSATGALGATADWDINITYYADKASVPAPSATTCVGELDPTMPHFYIKNGDRYSVLNALKDVKVDSSASSFNLNTLSDFASWKHKLVNKTGASTFLDDNTHSQLLSYLDSGIRRFNRFNPAVAGNNPSLFNF